MGSGKGVWGTQTEIEMDQLTVPLASTSIPTLSCSDIQSKNTIPAQHCPVKHTFASLKQTHSNEQARQTQSPSD